MYFDFVYLGDVFLYCKFDLYFMLCVVEVFGVLLVEIVVIGDLENDVWVVCVVGMCVFVVLYGYNYG